MFSHSWHNGTWNGLAELINFVTTFIKITVIALALLLSLSGKDAQRHRDSQSF